MDKKIFFAVPGSKVYISSFYKNEPKSFLNISLTGSECSLMCSHCRGVLLKSMASAATGNLYEIIAPKANNGLSGVLVSGGFNSRGVLELDRHYSQIKDIKTLFKDLKILIHAGFVDRKMAYKLGETGCDGVLLNVIGSTNAIENVYNLKGFKPQDYYDSLINLKQAGLKTAPHIVVGLDNADKVNEFEALKNILEIGADWLVLVSVKNLFMKPRPGIDRRFSESIKIKSSARKVAEIQNSLKPTGVIMEEEVNELKRNEINAEKILRLAEYCKKTCPDLKISLGCAKPSGKTGQILEAELIKTGVEAIAFPSEKTIIYAKDNNIDFKFVQSCCALLC
jgi:lipoyl synthase